MMDRGSDGSGHVAHSNWLGLMVEDVLAAPPTRSGSSFEELLEMLKPHGISVHSSPQSDESFRWHADIAIGAEIDVVRADLSAGWDWRYSYEDSAGELAIGLLNAGKAETLVAGKSVARTPSEIAIVPDSECRTPTLMVSSAANAGTLSAPIVMAAPSASPAEMRCTPVN